MSFPAAPEFLLPPCAPDFAAERAVCSGLEQVGGSALITGVRPYQHGREPPRAFPRFDRGGQRPASHRVRVPSGAGSDAQAGPERMKWRTGNGLEPEACTRSGWPRLHPASSLEVVIPVVADRDPPPRPFAIVLRIYEKVERPGLSIAVDR